MKRNSIFITIVCASVMTLLSCGTNTTGETYVVKVQQPVNGTIKIKPKLKADSLIAAGTTVKITAIPDKGYAHDATYYAFPQPEQRFQRNIETTSSTLELTIDKNTAVGATFIPEAEVQGYKTIFDVVYAQPGVKKLKYDVYSPDGAKNLPIIVIIHGGGWRMNTEEVMRGLSREFVKTGKYVVCNIDYRWADKGDGDAIPNTVNQLIEDVFGAIAHIQEHAAEYGGDPNNIAVTGDSAGGHLSAAAANMCTLIGDKGFGKTAGVYEYLPTYMPAGKTVAQVRDEITKAIKTAAPTYGAVTKNFMDRYANGDDFAAQALTPICNIPEASERVMPYYLLVGSEDRTVNPEYVKQFADSATAKGQRVDLVIVDGAGHAFLDWKCDERTQTTFKNLGMKYAADMIRYFNTVFYN